MKLSHQDKLKLKLDPFFKQSEKRSFTEYLKFSDFSLDFIPSWFCPMLQDHERNVFYRNMIAGKVKGKVVIDLGSGTGMWAIESLQQGAKFVYLVEKNTVLAEYLKVILKDYPVKIIHKDIHDLTNEDFDKGTPEIIVHEIFSTVAISEGVVPAFIKMNNLFPRNISYLPQYFWMDAYVNKGDPLTISTSEKNILRENDELYYEVIYPAQMRGRTKADFDRIDKSTQQSLSFIDLATIDENFKLKLDKISLDLSPGKVHQVHIGFSFSADKTGECFDSVAIDSHWGGSLAEFYVNKYHKAEKKSFEFQLNDIYIDTFVFE